VATLDYALLAEYARIDPAGLVTIVGGSFDRVQATSISGAQQTYVVMRVLLDESEEAAPCRRPALLRRGRPPRRPGKLHADKGYDYRRCRARLYRRGIKVRIARRRIEDKTTLGRVRWVIERTISWLLHFKRLGLRYVRTERNLRPLLTLARAIINIRRLAQTES
jgi:transposase